MFVSAPYGQLLELETVKEIRDLTETGARLLSCWKLQRYGGLQEGHASFGGTSRFL